MTHWDTVTASSGENMVIQIGDNETYENVLLDQTASGASISLRAVGTNWTIRNVGFRGSGSLGDHEYQLLIRDSGGGTSTVENVYINGKPGSEMGGSHVGSGHSGHINFRRTWIEGFGNNAAYCEVFGRTGGNDGSVSFDSCLHRDNTVSQYRIGTAPCLVENSVAIVNDPQGRRGTYPFSNSKLGRGVWAWHEDGMTVRNCSIEVNPNDTRPGAVFHVRQNDDSPSGDAVLYVEDTYVNDDAPTFQQTDSAGGGSADLVTSNIMSGNTVSVLSEGVPTGPEMAAEGNYVMPDIYDEDVSDPDPDPELDPEPAGVYESFINGSDGMSKYSGNTSQFSITGTNTYYGDYALTGDVAHGRIMNTSGDGPQRGDRFAQGFYPTNESDDVLMLHFAVQNGGGRYAVVADHRNEQLRFGSYVNGSWSYPIEESFDVSGTANQWNDLIVDFGTDSDDRIGCEYQDSDGNVLAQNSITDTAYHSGGWGYSLWSEAGNADYRVDYLRALENVSLNILDTNAPVEEGETLVVDYEIVNNTNSEVSDTVSLDLEEL